MTKPPRKKAAKAGTRKVSAVRRLSVTARHQVADATSTASLVLPEDAEVTALALDLEKMIEAARHQVAQTVNVGLTLLHWRIGQRIRGEILGEGHAAYGVAIVSTLSRQLASEAACTGKPYQTHVNPPPAGPRVAHRDTRPGAEKSG